MSALPPFVVLDLEVASGGSRAPSVTAVAAVRPDTSGSVTWRRGGGTLELLWRELANLTRGARLWVAHNGREHDRVFLRRLAPAGHSLLALPLVDTLELSPLAFPRNPYHRLIKDYKLVRAALSDPLSDCLLCQEVLGDELRDLSALSPKLLGVYRTLLGAVEGRPYDAVFDAIGAPACEPGRLEAELRSLLLRPPANFPEGLDHEQVCIQALPRVLTAVEWAPERWLALAYLLAWMTTLDGGISVVPSWVRRRHPLTNELVLELRGRPCADPACVWCRRAHDPEGLLRRFFGYPSFREDPGQPERSVQKEIVTSLMGGRSALGILPTGGGKSVCYQVPALGWAQARKTLTVVISPLQSLMKDQVDVLRERGIFCAAALYGGLVPPERKRVMDGVMLGDIDVLYVAPEQLRNRSFGKMLDQRHVGAWIIDEAHCLSKWGHDFRPDYSYIGPFIARRAKEAGGGLPTIGCFTATARREVIEEICAHFKEHLGIEPAILSGSLERGNLEFHVVEADDASRLATTADLIVQHLGERFDGAAIVYASTRAQADLLAEQLRQMGLAARAYHAGLELDRPVIQDDFKAGHLRLIVATNAFGMGVDKADVRLVVHASIPGSLEAYLQEAGRAGRDGRAAVCVLLYNPRDVDTQFRLQSTNRVSFRDLREILAVLRERTRRSHLEEEGLVITAGEILREPGIQTDIDKRDRQADTKVKAALHALERARLVERGDNRFGILQGRPQVRTLEDGRNKLEGRGLSKTHLDGCVRLLEALLASPSDELLSTDVLGDQVGLGGEELMRALETLREVGVTTQSLELSAVVRYGTEDGSRTRLLAARKREEALIRALTGSEDLPGDAGPGGAPLQLNLRALSTRLSGELGEAEARLPLLRRTVRALQEAKVWRTAPIGPDLLRAELKIELGQLPQESRRRLDVAAVVLDALLDRARAGGGKGEVSVVFCQADLEEAARTHITTALFDDRAALVLRALLWLHDQSVLVLQGGLAVLRPAMLLKVGPRSDRLKVDHYKPLDELYQSQVLHIHLMDEYARRGLRSPIEAARFVADYFRMKEEELLRAFLPERGEEVRRPVRPETYRAIVGALGSAEQEKIVTSLKPALLVLAGPGSGKTRVIVHRVAWLVAVKQVPPREILILSFNRSVAREIRARLRELIQDAAFGVNIHTFHSLALRVAGIDLSQPSWRQAMAAREEDALSRVFDDILRRAREVLAAPPGSAGEEGEWRREVLDGLRFVFVDEYQDVREAEYELLRALTGAADPDPDAHLTLMAVGDDDQSIYGFDGARVEYIRRFERDYHAKQVALLVNHRSTPSIVGASQALIALNTQRMKEGQTLRAARSGDYNPPVRLHRGRGLAGACRRALRLCAEMAARGLSSVAVLCRHRRQVDALQLLFHRERRPATRLAQGKALRFHQRRVVRQVLDLLAAGGSPVVAGSEVAAFVESLYGGRPLDAVGEELLELVRECLGGTGQEVLVRSLLTERIYERHRDGLQRPSRQSGVVLATLHAAKGLEFDGVVVIPGGPGHDPVEEERRLLYVGMTRARSELHLVTLDDFAHPRLRELLDVGSREEIVVEPGFEPAQEGDEDLGQIEIVDLQLSDLWVSYPARGVAGLMGEEIGRLAPGDPLELKLREGTIEVLSQGIRVGILSQAQRDRWIGAEGEWRVEITRAEVLDVVVLDRLPGGGEPAARWEVVVPQVTLRHAPPGEKAEL